MTLPNVYLQTFLHDSTAKQKQELADLAGTSVKNLYQLSGGHRPRTKAALAAGIERASDVIRQRDGKPNVRIPRESLCPDCDSCEHLKAARRRETGRGE